MGFVVAIIGYIRVSTLDQSLDAQNELLKAAGAETVFNDVGSGARLSRPGLKSALDYIRAGDTVLVHRLDRLARSLPDLLQIVQSIADKGAHLKSMTEQIDTGSAAGRLILQVFGAMAEFERALIIERTNIGLAEARRQGRTGGRKSAMTEAQAKQAKAYLAQGHTLREAAAKFKVSGRTIQRAINAAYPTVSGDEPGLFGT